MHALLRLAYGLTGQLARGLAGIAPTSDAKVWRAIRARRGIRERYRTWGQTKRDASRPLLWMHAPSVGEGLQARPILQIARQRRPDLQLAYTHFSPSAEPFARGLDVDFVDYLPFDTAGDAAAALDALQPRALVFSKLDVWPTLAAEASRRRVRLGLTSATLGAGSSRHGRLSSGILRDAYGRLDRVGAIDPDDAERLIRLGVHRDRLSVTGDTRYDQVWERAHGQRERAGVVRELETGRPTLVAGSTWPSDEAVLLEAWLEVRRRAGDARLVIAPHEPTPPHLEPIEAWGRQSRLTIARLSSPDARIADVVLVDRVGVLGDLYSLASVAYVGGGFHDAGLHSVLEPAAFGAPVLFGPRNDSSRDAGLLARSGGGAAVGSSTELAARLGEWLTDDGARRRAGDSARETVRAGLGAAERSWALVAELLA